MNKGLKALNDIRELVNRVEYASKIPNINNELDTIEKELKALEIIKEYGINVDYFKRHCDIEYDDEFNIYRIEEILTQEEYDLLIEVLYGAD